MSIKMYLVGGAVRDMLLGRRCKDWDFSVIADSFETMRDELAASNCEIYQEREQYGTIRAKWRNCPFADGKDVSADFVLCRKDGAYSDGRRPETVEPGTLMDDLARRDFTINAMAMDEAGLIIDPFHGQVDLGLKVIRCVGTAEDRINEDFLRAVRAVRFSVTLDFIIGSELMAVLRSDSVIKGVAKIPHERRSQELTKALAADTIKTIKALEGVSDKFMQAALADLRLVPTTRKRL